MIPCTDLPDSSGRSLPSHSCRQRRMPTPQAQSRRAADRRVAWTLHLPARRVVMNRMPCLTLGLVCLAMPFTVGACGLIFGGTRQTIQANSSPPGTTVTTAPPTATLTTPAAVSLERKKDYTLTFTKAGY